VTAPTEAVADSRKMQNNLRKRTDTIYYEAWLGVKGLLKIHLLDMLLETAKI
jgi:hypothetical protein